MPQSFCTVCRQRIPKGSRCRRHALKSPSNRSWHERGAQQVRQRVLKRDGYKCTRCGSTDDLEIHHVIPAADGGPTSMENLIVLCHQHHGEAEAAKRG